MLRQGNPRATTWCAIAVLSLLGIGACTGNVGDIGAPSRPVARDLPARPPQLFFAEPRAERPFTVTPAAMATLAQQPDLRALHHDLAVTCRPRGSGVTTHGVPNCAVSTVDANGVLTTVIERGVIAAYRVPGARMLVQHSSFALSIIESDGRELPIAARVVGTRLSSDGERVVYKQLGPGHEEPQPGAPAEMVLLDLRAGTRRSITRDPDAYGGFVVPGTDDVLYVSGRTGVASLWLSSPGRADRQLTNVGITSVRRGFQPVPFRELVWLPGTHRAIFTAHYATDNLVELNAETGTTQTLMPGHMPVLSNDGNVLSIRNGATSVQTLPLEPVI